MKLLADQFRAAGIAESDIHIMPYEALPGDQTAALIVRWRSPMTASWSEGTRSAYRDRKPRRSLTVIGETFPNPRNVRGGSVRRSNSSPSPGQ